MENQEALEQQEVKEASRDEKMWAMLTHISTFAAFVFPVGNIIAPLIIWLIKKDEFPLVDDQGKEVLNFQISMTIYIIASVVLVFFVIGIPVLIGLVIFDFIITIIGAVKANDGIKYRYPITIRFLN